MSIKHTDSMFRFFSSSSFEPFLYIHCCCRFAHLIPLTISTINEDINIFLMNEFNLISTLSAFHFPFTTLNSIFVQTIWLFTYSSFDYFTKDCVQYHLHTNSHMRLMQRLTNVFFFLLWSLWFVCLLFLCNVTRTRRNKKEWEKKDGAFNRRCR